MNVTFPGRRWSERGRTIVLGEIRTAHHLLRLSGLLHLCEAVPVECRYADTTPEGSAGHYNVEERRVVLGAKDYVVSDILLHEYGHAVFFERLSFQEQQAFTDWAERFTRPITVRHVEKLAKTYNAKHWYHLADALYRNDDPDSYRLRFLVRKGLGLDPDGPDTPKIPIAKVLDIIKAEGRTATFQYAFSDACVPYTERDYPFGWEIFAEAFRYAVADPTALPVPVRDKIQPILAKYRS